LKKRAISRVTMTTSAAAVTAGNKIPMQDAVIANGKR